MAEIDVDRVTKVYADGTQAVSEVSLEIADGSFVVLVGPSGCGKTTLLRMIAGLERISDGEIRVGGEAVNDVPPSRRDIAMVFQSYALYPHMSVADNMAFGLRRRGASKAEATAAVRRAAGVLGLVELLEKKPRALSGGQRQRVAMGRAIVRQPRAFLMDEPLSNLDAKLRGHMRAEIARLQRDLGVTTVYVTHDQTEAMTLGDVVAVMNHGRIQQLGPPQELFERPCNLFVAAFMGSPTMNLVEASLERAGDGLALSFGEHRLELPRRVLAERPALHAYAGRRVALGIRPEDLVGAGETAVADACELEATVELRELLGRTTHLHFVVGGRQVVTDDTRAAADEAGEETAGGDGAGCRMIASVGSATGAAEGERVRLAVDPAALHVFDLGSGAAIREQAQEVAGALAGS
ncbi:ABC transporter ATP-binding protein [Conexibacter woesei]|uniref:ABC transporter related protein n=1 Tax=Conexibacter woesei (strain DSM 14684 / CCUG 47730 / CIP 108061 / JCM 11494 / NBRC 100937 / ID131577) TaxID=469383 RepID=D3FDB1_CONWI|nr:sn-glycerol-3-phosphate ABC transporter ATP-binding protein UgpC [Conexibacter woesei]ADB53503.1 ABC transporter related protein [Conexibacter woesei DSM 14684]